MGKAIKLNGMDKSTEILGTIFIKELKPALGTSNQSP
jgi:hypothetical protein